MKKMKRVSILAVILLAVAGIGCDGSAVAIENEASGSIAAPVPAAATGSAAPAFTLEDQTGRKVSLSDYAGQIVVLEWINPDCPFVVRHGRAGTMRTLAEKYKDQGVVWVGVNSTHYMTKDHNTKWIETAGLSYPILQDPTGEVGRLYGAKTTPHMYIIDKAGNLVYQGGIDDDPNGQKGAAALNYVDQALAEITAGKPISVAQSKPYGCSVKYKG